MVTGFLGTVQQNNLPFHIPHLSSMESFKYALKTHLFLEHYSWQQFTDCYSIFNHSHLFPFLLLPYSSSSAESRDTLSSCYLISFGISYKLSVLLFILPFPRMLSVILFLSQTLRSRSLRVWVRVKQLAHLLFIVINNKDYFCTKKEPA